MRKAICYWVSLLFIGLLFSCGGKRPLSEETADAQTPENTFDWQGTYEGVIPAADCPGIYVLLAVDSGHYQCAYKYIERAGIYVSKGKIKWNEAGDSIALVGNHVAYKVEGGLLRNGISLLNKISNTLVLPNLLINQTLKDNKTGENAVLQQYSMGQKQYADLYFKNKVYKMRRDEKITHQVEYVDDKAKLQFKPNEAKFRLGDIPVFIDDKDTCDFTVLSPVDEIYVAKGKPSVTSSFDVLYLNGEEGSEVKLLNPQYKYCFTLPQIEASAKTAEYYSNGVMWSSGLHGATFTLGDQQYQFVQQAHSKK